MARPQKVGLNYFPLDCQLDEKFEMLEDTYQSDGFTVVIKAFQACYLTEFGELDINDVLRCKTYSKRAHVTLERWEEIIKSAAMIGLFNRKKYAKRILTSDGIKKRIAKVRKDREKARDRSSANNSRETPEESTNNARIRGERKLKETKGNSLKKEREDRSADAPLDSHTFSQSELRQELDRALTDWSAHQEALGRKLTPQARQALIDTYRGKPIRALLTDIRFSLSKNAKSVISAPSTFRPAPAPKPVSRQDMDPKVVELSDELARRLSIEVVQTKEAI